MGLYSARTLPPPHVFLGDLPNQIQFFDFSKVNAGEAAPPTPYQRSRQDDFGDRAAGGRRSGHRFRARRGVGNPDPVFPLVRQPDAAHGDTACADLAVRLAARRGVPVRHRRQAGHLPGVPRGVLHHRAGHHCGDRRRQEDLPGRRPDHGRDPPAGLFSGHPAGRPARAVHDPAAQSVRGLDDRPDRGVRRLRQRPGGARDAGAQYRRGQSRDDRHGGHRHRRVRLRHRPANHPAPHALLGARSSGVAA